mmetsp:Transcript_5703/g.9048  ORF Transcript_5703/g.9048 Transcript_5703/m.9048 type:complete len:188 (+) Transcript_5703:2361-2924(+)
MTRVAKKIKSKKQRATPHLQNVNEAPASDEDGFSEGTVASMSVARRPQSAVSMSHLRMMNRDVTTTSMTSLLMPTTGDPTQVASPMIGSVVGSPTAGSPTAGSPRSIYSPDSMIASQKTLKTMKSPLSSPRSQMSTTTGAAPKPKISTKHNKYMRILHEHNLKATFNRIDDFREAMKDIVDKKNGKK